MTRATAAGKAPAGDALSGEGAASLRPLSRSSRWRLFCLSGSLAALVAVSVSACGSDDGNRSWPLVAVLSAFPAELAPLLEEAAVEQTVVVEGRVFRVGTLAGVPVVLGLTGIGLVNAAATTRAVLDRFAVTGVVVSGVAGSLFRIGDVTVPEAWELADGARYAADRGWLDLAIEIAAPGVVRLERCTLPPEPPLEEPVCLSHLPAILPGGLGRSSDPFGGAAVPCQPDGGDVFGCDVAPEAGASPAERERGATVVFAQLDTEPAVVEDMETAAIAHEAALRGVPFVAFRAVSDGEGDPLGLPGFPGQFFAYYRLAARNAAAAAVAFLERVAAGNG